MKLEHPVKGKGTPLVGSARPLSGYTPIWTASCYIWQYISGLNGFYVYQSFGGVWQVGPRKLGNRFVLCRACMRAGLVRPLPDGFGTRPGQLVLNQQSWGFKKMNRRMINSSGVLRVAIDCWLIVHRV